MATLTLDIDEDGGIRPGYKLKLNSYDLGVDIELHDALQRIRFEHPEVRASSSRAARSASSARARTSSCSGLSTPRVEGELLQVHQRDAQRHRGLEPAFRPQVHRRVQRHDRRRRLRARARVRRDHSGRRPLLGGEPARGAAARRAAGHRRPYPRHRQAPGAARSRRYLLHQRRRRARQAREGMAARRRSRRSRSSSAQHVQAARAWRSRAKSDRPAGAEGRRAHAARARTIDADGATATSTSTVQIDARTRTRRSPSSAPQGRAAAGHRRRSSPRAPTWWPLAMARELDDAILMLRTNELDIGTWLLKTEGRRRRTCSPPTRRIASAQVALVRARDDRHAAAHARAARRVVAHAVRADRAGLLLRRHARSSWRSPPTAATCSRCRTKPARAPTIALSTHELRHAIRCVNGHSRLARALLRRGGSRSQAARAAIGKSARRRRSARRSASSPPRPTRSTGPTKSASRSKSARACRRTR